MDWLNAATDAIGADIPQVVSGSSHDNYAREDRQAQFSWSRLFQEVPDTTPEFMPMTTEEQDRMGENMGLPMRQWRKLAKQPVLTLPQTLACQSWLNWATSMDKLPRGAGIMLMTPANYMEQLNLNINGPGRRDRVTVPHTVQDQDTSIRKNGHPIVFWQ